jgi:hypothetical protein
MEYVCDKIDPTDFTSHIQKEYSQNNENSGVTIESVNPVDIRPSVYESEDGRIMFDVLFDVCWSVQTIFGGNSKEEAAQIFKNVLEGKGTYEQNAVVISNAAKALQNTGKYENYEASLAAAKESLESGKALECLNKLIIK